MHNAPVNNIGLRTLTLSAKVIFPHAPHISIVFTRLENQRDLSTGIYCARKTSEAACVQLGYNGGNLALWIICFRLEAPWGRDGMPSEDWMEEGLVRRGRVGPEDD